MAFINIFKKAKNHNKDKKSSCQTSQPPIPKKQDHHLQKTHSDSSFNSSLNPPNNQINMTNKQLKKSTSFISKLSLKLVHQSCPSKSSVASSCQHQKSPSQYSKSSCQSIKPLPSPLTSGASSSRPQLNPGRSFATKDYKLSDVSTNNENKSLPLTPLSDTFNMSELIAPYQNFETPKNQLITSTPMNPKRSIQSPRKLDFIDCSSFDDDISSKNLLSPTARTARSASSNFFDTDDGSIIDANIQIFKTYSHGKQSNLRFISTSSPIPSESSQDHINTSTSPSPLPRVKSVGKLTTIEHSHNSCHLLSEDISDPIDDYSGDEELEFSDSKEFFRSELLSLVQDHKLLIEKHEDEIKKLKTLLQQEREVVSRLSSPQTKSTPRFNYSEVSPQTTLPANRNKKRRSGFIPFNIVVSTDASMNDSSTDLLPPFKPGQSESLNSPTIKSRKPSLGSNASSVMSTSHQIPKSNGNVQDYLGELGIIHNYQEDSSYISQCDSELTMHTHFTNPECYLQVK